MTAAAKLDAFGAMLAATRALYRQEIARLAEEFRLRILAGEFSGSEETDGIGPVGWQRRRGDPRYLRLERELEDGLRHPWLATERGRLVVVACSGWFDAVWKAVSDPRTGARLSDGFDGSAEGAAECMTHDVLAEAAKRGWVKPMRYLGDRQLYARVA